MSRRPSRPSGTDFALGAQPGPLSPEIVRLAQLTVAHHATDAQDCRDLLEMLDLLPTMKRCSRCRRLKSRDQFYAAAETPDGRRRQCRQCQMDARTARRAAGVRRD